MTKNELRRKIFALVDRVVEQDKKICDLEGERIASIAREARQAERIFELERQVVEEQNKANNAACRSLSRASALVRTGECQATRHLWRSNEIAAALFLDIAKARQGVLDATPEHIKNVQAQVVAYQVDEEKRIAANKQALRKEGGE